MSTDNGRVGGGARGATTDGSGTPGPGRDDHNGVVGKPETPTKLTKPAWKYIARKTFREFSDDQCTDLAAALTYYAVLALFPALLALVSLLGLFGQAGKTDQLVQVLSDMGAGSVADTIRGPLAQLTENSSAGLGLIIGIAGALWSASGYVGAFGRSMNRIYEIQEGRPFWKLRPLMIIITLAAVILAGLVAIGLVVSGPVARAIGEAIGLGDTAVTVWGIVKWPILLGLATVVVAILYYAPRTSNNPNSGGSPSEPSSRSSPGSSRPPCSGSTCPSSPTTTKPTVPSPESSSSCCGYGSPTWHCCSAPN
jgi:membrane protein